MGGAAGQGGPGGSQGTAGSGGSPGAAGSGGAGEGGTGGVSREPACGNGIREDGEACDRGFLNSDSVADACRSDCTLPRCGDGVVDAIETCDDGDLAGGPCPSHCGPSTCGDGVVDRLEQCDEGSANSDSEPDACRRSCRKATCGDGVIDPGRKETCDDRNRVSTDGCSAACTAEVRPAGSIRIRLRGEVVHVEDRAGIMDGLIEVGDPVDADYTYDPETADSNGHAGVGDYWQRTTGLGLRVFVAGLVIETDPRAPEFLVEVVDGAFRQGGTDHYLLRSYKNLPVPGSPISHVSWQLDAMESDAIVGDALPRVPPRLELFRGAEWGLRIEGFDRDGWWVRCRIDSAEVEP